ncbi:GQ67_01287T0 [Komagataella phaffii]|nr:GQ67_01287T0 [Komagataella phaffii]
MFFFFFFFFFARASSQTTSDAQLERYVCRFPPKISWLLFPPPPHTQFGTSSKLARNMPEQAQRTKTALVTGASSGIGFELCKELSARGFRVFGAARRLEPMESLREYGVTPLKADVSDLDSVLELKKKVIELTDGKLDLLYNNAGQSCTVPALDVSDEWALQCLQVNVLGPIRMTREFAPLLIAAQGIVVFTGSLAGICPFPWGSVYGASKAAIHQYASVLHLELEPLGVKVLNVVTGGVDTNIADTRDLPKDSVYASPEMLEAFELRKKMAEKNKPMSPATYSKKVVNDILSSRDPVHVYRGKMATFMGIVMYLVPTRVIEYAFRIKFKLNPAFDALREKYSKRKVD